MGMVAASMLPNGNSSSPKRQEQGGQQRSVAAPAGPVVPLPNNNLGKDNRNSLTKVCMHLTLSLFLFLSLSLLNKTRRLINLQKEDTSGGKGAASAGSVQERVKDPKVRESVILN